MKGLRLGKGSRVARGLLCSKTMTHGVEGSFVSNVTCNDTTDIEGLR